MTAVCLPVASHFSHVWLGYHVFMHLSCLTFGEALTAGGRIYYWLCFVHPLLDDRLCLLAIFAYLCMGLANARLGGLLTRLCIGFRHSCFFVLAPFCLGVLLSSCEAPKLRWSVPMACHEMFHISIRSIADFWCRLSASSSEGG